MNHYEAVTLLVPEMTDKDVQKYVDELGELLSSSGAVELGPARVERRPLAYPVKKRTEGYYVHIHFDGPPTLPETVRSELKHREGILRLAFVRGPKPEPVEEPVAAGLSEDAGPEAQEAPAEPEASETQPPEEKPDEETERGDG